MKQKRRILAVVGTRPEAIKMAPVIRKLKAESWCECFVLATGQHRALLDQALRAFAIEPDADIGVMQSDQSLPALTSRLISGLDEILTSNRPDALLAQGDTTTVMAAALVAFYHRISCGHIEAGLRTGNLEYPYPEEMNRAVTARLARWHFAPTSNARENLLREGVPAPSISVTGNPVIDALRDVESRPDLPVFGTTLGRRLILVTAHRRENLGRPMESVFLAIRRLAENRQDVEFLYPLHPNPQVGSVARQILGGQPRIRLCKPLDYVSFVSAMKASYLILSDSGGVQEEGPALGKPVLVLRSETERPEAVAAGGVKLVGTDAESIVVETGRLLDDESEYRRMGRRASPYGDGHAAERIVEILRQDLAR